jgi:UDP-2-acetamido-2,6-beta-L-arabino-hexul-4-ose reductase
MTVGINGYGFIGYHLWVYLNYKCKDISVIRLSRNLENDLDNLSKCDVVIHMAEKNRGYPSQLYKDNKESAKHLTKMLDKIGNKPTIIYTSSTHEDDDDLYGKWRRENNKMFSNWTNDFKSIKLPNIFGPFCKPNYNSFIATFCDKILKNEELQVNDNNVNLLYVENLCSQIYKVIKGDKRNISYDQTVSVKYVYDTLLRFKQEYLSENKIPKYKNEFELNLFNTFRSYLDKNNRLLNVDNYNDDRGRLSELIISKNQGQIFFSTTKPGIVRGNHFHTRRIERFCVLEGEASVKMRKIGTNEIIEYKIKGTDNKVIDMPVYYTHNLENINNTELICCFWMNDILKEQKIDDTYYEEI